MASVGDKLFMPDFGEIGSYSYLVPAENEHWVPNCPSANCPLKRMRSVKLFPTCYEPIWGELGWPAFNTAIGHLIVKREVAILLALNFKGLRLAEVMVLGKAAKKEMLSEMYFELICETQFPPSAEWMPNAEVKRCAICGDESISAAGVERDPIQIKIGDRWEWDEGVKRKPGEGILIPEHLIKNHEMIRCGPHLCTQRFKEYIQTLNMPAVKFWEYGEVV